MLERFKRSIEVVLE